MDQVQVDVEQGRLARRLGDDVPLPDLLEQRLCHAVTLVCKAGKAECPGDRASAHPRPPAVRLRGDRCAQARAAPRRRGRDRPRLRQPGHRLARDGGREARARRPRSRATTATRRAAASRTCASAICELYERRFGVDARPGARGDHDDRRQGGARAPALGAASSRATPRSCRPELPDPHVRARVRRRDASRRWRWARRRTSSANLADAYERTQPQPARRHRSRSRTTRRRRSSTPRSCSALVDFARERDVVLVHDFAYADIAFDGHEPPSILAAEGARECAVELYTLTKGFSMAGWRVGFCVGNAEVVAGLGAAQVVPRLRHVPADPDRRDRDDARGGRVPASRCARSTAAGATRCATGSRGSGGRCRGRRGRCSSGRRSRSRSASSARTSSRCGSLREANVSVSPGGGFGPGGDGHVRFALVENEQRIGQAVRGIRRVLETSLNGKQVAAAAAERRRLTRPRHAICVGSARRVT